MRAILLLLLVGAPVVLATPAPGTPDDASVLGIASQGSVDRAEDWYAAWYGPDGWACTANAPTYVVTLSLLDGAETDVLALAGAGTWDDQVEVLATRHAPAVVYAPHHSGCPEFAVLGRSVVTQARYVVEVRSFPFGYLP